MEAVATVRVTAHEVSDSSEGGEKGFRSGCILRVELVGFASGFDTGSEKKWATLVMPRVLVFKTSCCRVGIKPFCPTFAASLLCTWPAFQICHHSSAQRALPCSTHTPELSTSLL